MQYGLCKLTPEQVRGDKVISSVTGWGYAPPLWLGYSHTSMAATLAFRVVFTFVQDDVSPARWPG